MWAEGTWRLIWALTAWVDGGLILFQYLFLGKGEGCTMLAEVSTHKSDRVSDTEMSEWECKTWFLNPGCLICVFQSYKNVESWDCPLYLKQLGLSCREPHSTLLLCNTDKWPLKINCDLIVSPHSCISFPAKPGACKWVKGKDQSVFIISVWCCMLFSILRHNSTPLNDRHKKL